MIQLAPSVYVVVRLVDDPVWELQCNWMGSSSHRAKTLWNKVVGKRRLSSERSGRSSIPKHKAITTIMRSYMWRYMDRWGLIFTRPVLVSPSHPSQYSKSLIDEFLMWRSEVLPSQATWTAMTKPPLKKKTTSHVACPGFPLGHDCPLGWLPQPSLSLDYHPPVEMRKTTEPDQGI